MWPPVAIRQRPGQSREEVIDDVLSAMHGIIDDTIQRPALNKWVVLLPVKARLILGVERSTAVLRTQRFFNTEHIPLVPRARTAHCTLTSDSSAPTMVYGGRPVVDFQITDLQ